MIQKNGLLKSPSRICYTNRRICNILLLFCNQISRFPAVKHYFHCFLRFLWILRIFLHIWQIINSFQHIKQTICTINCNFNMNCFKNMQSFQPIFDIFLVHMSQEQTYRCIFADQFVESAQKIPDQPLIKRLQTRSKL